MTRPAHSAARDAAFGRWYAKRGATNALQQAERGNGSEDDNLRRVAEWRNKAARIPREIRDKHVPHGAGVVLIFRPVIKRPRLVAR